MSGPLTLPDDPPTLARALAFLVETVPCDRRRAIYLDMLKAAQRPRRLKCYRGYDRSALDQVRDYKRMSPHLTENSILLLVARIKHSKAEPRVHRSIAERYRRALRREEKLQQLAAQKLPLVG